MTEMRFCPKCGTERLVGAAFCHNCGMTFADAPAPSGPASSQVPMPVAAGLNLGGAVTLAGGALAILGSFLPWISATAGLSGTISRSGIEAGGDGIITIAVGLLAVLFGIARLARPGRDHAAQLGGLVTGVALVLMSALEVDGVNSRVVALRASDGIFASAGSGLYVIALGGVLSTIGSLMGLRGLVASLAAARRPIIAGAAVLAVLSAAGYAITNVRLPWTPPAGFDVVWSGEPDAAFRWVTGSDLQCTYDSRGCAALDVATRSGCPGGLEVVIDVLNEGGAQIGQARQSLRGVAAGSTPRLLFDFTDPAGREGRISSAACR